MRSIHYLNAAQFSGALNDNLFKVITAYFLINLYGKVHSPLILSLCGFLFVVPFLLFSGFGGELSARFPMHRIVQGCKLLESLIAMIGIFGFMLGSPLIVLVVFTLLSLQSALFGPTKYGILPSLVQLDRGQVEFSKALSNANGSVISLTYIAVILGTFLASLLTDLFSRNFILISLFPFLLALFGFLASLKLPSTPPLDPNSHEQFTLFKGVIQTLKQLKNNALARAIEMTAIFLFLGSYLQMNSVPYAISNLNLKETAGGYLFFVSAFGIAVGSYICGKINQSQRAFQISAMGFFGAAISFLALGIFTQPLFIIILLIFLLGVFSGFLILPMETYLQEHSGEQMRARVIAANHVVGFSMILVASMVLLFFGSYLKLPPTYGFILMGCVALIASLRAFTTRAIQDL